MMYLVNKINRSLFNSFMFADSVIMGLIETDSVCNITYMIIKFTITTVFIIDSRLLDLRFKTDHRGLYQNLMNTKYLHYYLS